MGKEWNFGKKLEKMMPKKREKKTCKQEKWRTPEVPHTMFLTSCESLFIRRRSSTFFSVFLFNLIKTILKLFRSPEDDGIHFSLFQGF